eukprot:6186263-Pleurochrysis_carterae.AAC.1
MHTGVGENVGETRQKVLTRVVGVSYGNRLPPNVYSEARAPCFLRPASTDSTSRCPSAASAA